MKQSTEDKKDEEAKLKAEYAAYKKADGNSNSNSNPTVKSQPSASHGGDKDTIESGDKDKIEIKAQPKAVGAAAKS